jgi:hypothetical protein
MEWWSDGFEPNTPIFHILQHSILWLCLASEIFLSSLQTRFFNNLNNTDPHANI